MSTIDATGISLIQTRRSFRPKRLGEPGPSQQQLYQLLHTAIYAPDHDKIVPWRLVFIASGRRAALAEVFAAALLTRDRHAEPEALQRARDKAHYAPVLLAAIVKLRVHESEIPDTERLLSLGAALQNIQLCAHAMGFGAGLTSGKAMNDPHLREFLALTEHERAVAFLSIGTPGARPARWPMPAWTSYVTGLDELAVYDGDACAA